MDTRGFARSGAHFEGPRGELYRQEDGVRIGALRDDTLYAEGRLAAVRKRDELSVSEARDLEISKLFIGRELESLARVTAEVVCDQWGARSTGSMNSCGRVGSGRRGPMRLPASSFAEEQDTSSQRGTADGPRYAILAS